MGAVVTRNLDIVALALALPVFLAAGFPMVGYAGGAVAYLLQRLVADLLARRADRAEDYRTKLGLVGGSMVARGWLAALLIFGTYLVDDESAGLAAAVLFLFVFTIGFTTMVLTRAGEKLDEATRANERRRP
jgi:hypothetical protein